MLVELIEQQASGNARRGAARRLGATAAPLRSGTRAFRKTTRSALNRTSASGPIWDRVEPPHFCASQSTPEIRDRPLWRTVAKSQCGTVARRLVHTDSFRRQHRPGHLCHVLRRARLPAEEHIQLIDMATQMARRRYRSKGRRRNAAYGVRRRFDRNAHHRSRWEIVRANQASPDAWLHAG